MKTILSIVIALVLVSVAIAAESLAKRLHSKDFWTKVKAIKEVAEQPEKDKRKHLPTLLEYLKDKDQTIRTVSASTIARMAIDPEKAIPALLKNYNYPRGEEGTVYVDAVAAYGEASVPYLNKALNSPEWLIRIRACDTLIQIKKNRERFSMRARIINKPFLLTDAPRASQPATHCTWPYPRFNADQTWSRS